IQREIDYYNTQLGDTEKIKKFRVFDEEFSIQSGELTPSMKLRRDFICSKYKDVINDIYS
ncbi:MAG: long-chain fatty acid--CoA ligase, partial [Bacteroidota bacterium]